MTDASATLLSSNGIKTREQVNMIPTPPGTSTHKLYSHGGVVDALYDTLGLRKIGVTRDQYAVSHDGMRLYFTMDLDTGFPGGNFTIGGRNSHDKSMALGITAGYRVAVCDNGMFRGDYTPVMRKHTKNFNLEDALSVGIDNILRNFEPMVKDVQLWRETQIADVTAKMCIYEAFVEGQMELPKHLMRPTHEQYFNPQHEEFRPRTLWSLQNAFTGAAKVLDEIPYQRAAVSIGEYFQRRKA